MIRGTIAGEPQAPYWARWLGETLRAVPGPTDGWADVIGHLAWPLLVLFLVYRFRWFLRRFLLTLADRMQTDHVRFGWFEIRADDQVMVLDAEDAGESTLEFDPADIQRIERIFEFIDEQANFERLDDWVNKNVGPALDIEDFLTLPEYATLRELAFDQVEGLAK